MTTLGCSNVIIFDDWVHVRSAAEEQAAEQARIRAVAEKALQPRDEEVVYTHKELQQVDLRRWTGEPYLRRSDVLPKIYNCSEDYYVNMAEQMIRNALHPMTITPVGLFYDKLAEHNPYAMRLAATLLELKKGVGEVPENSRVIEEGRITFDPHGFTIKGDKVVVEEAVTYEMTRRVTVEYSEMARVVCRVETTFKEYFITR